MHPLLARGLLALGLVLLGGLLGWWLGLVAWRPGAGALLGAVSGLLVFGIQDGLRAGRLLRWLRSAQLDMAPRDASGAGPAMEAKRGPLPSMYSERPAHAQ